MRKSEPGKRVGKAAPAAQTPMAFAITMAAAARRAGIDPIPLLALAQIAPTDLHRPQTRITSGQMEALSGAAMRAMNDEALGAFSRALPWGSYGLLARASLSAPRLGLALRRWCRHHGLLTGDVALRLDTDAEHARLCIDEARPITPPDPQTREFGLVHLMRNVHGLACWLVDSRIPLREARFPFAPPPHASAYAHMFPGQQVFGAERAELCFDARYLELPVCRDETAMNQMLQRALPLTVRQYRRDRLLVEQVRQALRRAEGAQWGAVELAAHLHLSVRSLQRQLADEGASLQALKDEVRFERAREALRRTDKATKQIAAQCGFAHEKSFIRAFRDWAGMPPGEWRRR